MECTVIVIGGGLAGLTASLELARSGVNVWVIERKSYPAHKVCGEYVSNEVRPYLEALGLALSDLGAVPVARLSVSSPRGSVLEAPLESGGFGISRYTLDHALYRLCVAAGVHFLLNTSVTDVRKADSVYEVQTNHGETYRSQLVIGAYGKKSNLDVKSKRQFTRKTSPYIAVKYHVRYDDHPSDLISLHNFKNGYCGISAVEGRKSCLCYLTHRSNLDHSGGNLERMQRDILSRNPHLKKIFANAEFLYDKPLVINQVSFGKKNCVEGGILMTGDSAGLIAPLCGNGMAIAVHSAKVLSSLVIGYVHGGLGARELDYRYQKEWSRAFGLRLAAGRILQATFGNEWVTGAVLRLLRNSSFLTRRVIGLTHGEDINTISSEINS